jgi:hypothetical protein
MVKVAPVTVVCEVVTSVLAAGSTVYHNVSHPFFNFRYTNPI